MPGEIADYVGLDPAGPFEGARKLADAHLRTWVDAAQMPDGPPLA